MWADHPSLLGRFPPTKGNKMTNKDSTIYVSITGKKVVAVVEQLMGPLAAVPTELAVTACLSLAVMLQKPDIETEELRDCIYETSQFLCMMLAGDAEVAN